MKIYHYSFSKISEPLIRTNKKIPIFEFNDETTSYTQTFVEDIIIALILQERQFPGVSLPPRDGWDHHLKGMYGVFLSLSKTHNLYFRTGISYNDKSTNAKLNAKILWMETHGNNYQFFGNTRPKILFDFPKEKFSEYFVGKNRKWWSKKFKLGIFYRALAREK